MKEGYHKIAAQPCQALPFYPLSDLPYHVAKWPNLNWSAEALFVEAQLHDSEIDITSHEEVLV